MTEAQIGSRSGAADPRLALVGVTLGALAALALSPTWVPVLVGSLTGEAPKAYWYLTRASGLVAYALVWLSVVLGLMQSSGVARGIFVGPGLFEAHRHAAWAGLAFAALHAAVLLGDRHVGGDLVAIAVPFAMTRHAPGWVGLGQLALYGGLVVAISFRLRGRLGAKAWRALHFASFTVFALIAAHATLAGTDARHPWVAAAHGLALGVVIFLIVLRAAAERKKKRA